MPSGPPMSPLTRSYFTTWAFFDLRFGPDRETIGTCLLDVGESAGDGPGRGRDDPPVSESRMGIYEHAGAEGGRCLLRELVTDDEFDCYVPAGYPGKHGGTLVRAALPADRSGRLPRRLHDAVRPARVRRGGLDGVPEQVADRADDPGEAEALHELLKYGREPDHRGTSSSSRRTTTISPTPSS